MSDGRFRGLHGLVLYQAAKDGDATALLDAHGNAMTYAQLVNRSDAWLAQLYAAGIAPGERVGVALPRSMDLICALLAVLRAGCAYVPLDPMYPAAWLQFALTDADVAAVLCEPGATVDQAAGTIVRCFAPAADEPRAGRDVDLDVDVEVTPDTISHVIYTSGSTGTSKGVLIRHGGGVNLLHWSRTFYSRDELRVVLFATSICFDLSVFEIFVPLSVGGAVYVVEDAFALIDHVPHTALSLINTVPSVMAELVRLDAVPSGVLAVNLAGEALSGKLVDTLYDRFGVGRVCNLYGPSETTTYSTCGIVLRGEAQPTVGRPIRDTKIVLIDEAGAAVANGETGEICIAGAGVAAGYLGRAELTAEQFRAITDVTGLLRVYATGDIGRWRADGQLDFVGRRDEQIKLRGFRIELGHIEHCIKQQAGVADAAVVDVGGIDDRRLAAYVVSSRDADEHLIASVRQAVAAALPTHMLPSCWSVVVALPRLPNGKVDRHALRRTLAETAIVAVPDSALGPQHVAMLMAAVLGLATVGLDENFFDAGGDSHRACVVTFRLREASCRRIPLSMIYTAPTPTDLAAALASVDVSDATPDDAMTALSSDEAFGRLTRAQSQLLQLSAMAGDDPIGNVALSITFDDDCAAFRIKQAVAELRARHALLRADVAAGRWVAAAGTFVVDDVECADLDMSAIETASLALAVRPLGLGHGSLWSATLFRIRERGLRLVLAFHHVLVDEQAIQWLLEDFSTLLSGQPMPEADRISIGTAARLEMPAADAAVAIWRTRFAHARPMILPRGRRHAGMRADSYRSRRQQRHFDAAFHRHVVDAARALGLTPYEFLLGTFLPVLGRYVGSSDIVVALVVSTRDEQLTGRSLGFRCEWLPLVFTLDPAHGWSAHFAAVRDAVRELQAHRFAAADIQTYARVLTTGPGGALPVRFGLMRAPAAMTAGHPWTVEEIDTGYSDTPLNFQVRLDRDGLSLCVDGLERVCDDDALAWFIDHWSTTIDAAVTGPRNPSTSASSPDARATLTPTADERSVSAWFDDVVRRQPDHPAIDDGTPTTYRELDAASRRLAAGLRAMLPPDCDLVVVHCADPVQAIQVFFACLRLGLTFVPINPEEPDARVAAIVHTVGARHAIVDRDVAATSADRVPLERHTIPQLLAASDAAGTTVPSASLPNAGPAYVLFTSGSTGRPKGVAQSESALAHHIATFVRSIGLGPNDRVSLMANVGYDAAFMDIFGALLAGACLLPWVVAQRGLDGIGSWLVRERVSVLHATPSVFRSLCSSLADTMRLRDLRCVVLGGESAMPQDLALFARHCEASARLVNGYGPTESTMALQATFGHADACSHATLPVGHAVGGADIVLCSDGLGHDTEQGEIEIRSPWVCLGYVELPGDLARLRCVPAEQRRRQHRTGDIARRLPDGSLLVLGRADDQVKISGMRIEPAEIESALLDVDGVMQACVLPRTLENGRVVLNAYVQLHTAATTDALELRTYLLRRLPAAMVPAGIAIVAALPYLPNGKIDRASVRQDDVLTQQAEQQPVSALERDLGRLWCQHLGIAAVSPDDTFVELGGTSLTAMSLVVALEREWQVRLPPSRLLANPSLAALALEVAQHARTVGTGVVPERRLTMSAQQTRFWFLHQLHEGDDRNGLLFAARLTRRADRVSLDRALTEVLLRHDGLRCIVDDSADEAALSPLAPAASAVALEWFERDRADLPIGVDDLPAALRAPFDLKREMPLRAAGISTPHGDYVVLLCHHIAVDARSCAIVLRDLDAYYAFFRDGDPIPPGNHSPSLGQVTQRLARDAHLACEQGGITYWRQALDGMPLMLDLPGRTLPRASRSGCLRARRTIDAALSQELDRFCRDHALTAPAVLLTVQSLMLSRLCGQNALIVGMPVSLRDEATESNIVAPLLNVVPIACRIERELSFADHCRRTARRIAESLDHRHIPFDAIVSAVAPERALHHHPVYQVSFSYHDFDAAEQPPWSELLPVDTESGTIGCDLALTIERRRDRIDCFLDAAHGQVHPRLLARLIEQFDWLLRNGLETPIAPLREQPTLPPAQRRELVERLATDAPGKQPRVAIIDAIRTVARDYGGRAALCGRDELDYAQLLAQADAVAAQLSKEGVRSGDFVAFLVHDRVNPVVAQLGALIADAAFTPIDPAWPEAMITTVKAATGARVVIEATPSCENALATIRTMDATDEPFVAPRCAGALYAMATSGTTGLPKVVAVSHDGILNRFAWMSDFFGAAPVTLQTTPITFDSSVWQLLWPLTCGGRCVIPTRGEIFDAVAFAALVEREHVDVIDFVPSILQALLPEFEQSPTLRAQLQQVRWVIVGAERFPAETARRVRALLPMARLVNLYGPTEASIGCVFHELVDPVPTSIPIGRPISNVQVALVDDDGELVPRGAIGELVLMGVCVGIGYLKPGDQGGFRACSVVEFANRRAFHTGDYARWDERGNLEFHGRRDRQIKLRGVRIEVEAIEAALLRHPAINAVIVALSAPEADAPAELIAFVQTSSVTPPDTNALHAWCRQQLPASLLPDRIEWRQRFPLQASGKIDVVAMLQSVTPRTSTVAVEPSTEIDAGVRTIWNNVLRADMPLDDRITFFEAGGHSLLLLVLRQQIERAFGVSISVVDLFRHPTVYLQARLVKERRTQSLRPDATADQRGY